MVRTSILARFSRRLVLAPLLGAALLACSPEDEKDTSPGGATSTGNLLQFTVEGPGISRRTATFSPAASDFFLTNSAGLLFNIGAGSSTAAVSSEGEQYGQVKFSLESAMMTVGSHKETTGGLQLAVYPTPADASQQANDKVIRSAEEDGLPGGLDLIVSAQGDRFVEGTFSGTLNCTNCTPAESYTVTAGTFRFQK